MNHGLKSEDSQWSAAGQLSQPSDVYSSTSAVVCSPLRAEHAGSAARAAKLKAKATAIAGRRYFDSIWLRSEGRVSSLQGRMVPGSVSPVNSALPLRGARP